MKNLYRAGLLKSVAGEMQYKLNWWEYKRWA